MYSKEDLKFLNMNSNLTIGKEKIFSIENTLSIEEKVAFIDELENGVATHLINIFTKWETEKDSLSKDSHGSIKTVSKKAWIKRNDERKIIDVDYKIGKYYLLGNSFGGMSLICPYTEYNRKYLYTDDNVVKQWFHDLCEKLYRQEKEYFESINPFDIKLEKVNKYANKYHIYFDNEKINNIAWNNTGYKNNVTEKELDIFIEGYEKLEKNIENVTNDVNVKLWDLA